jgi:hypothetical protein
VNINVPDWARGHFWEEPPPGNLEFWAFRFKPPVQVGDELIFKFDGTVVARAVCAKIEPPGQSECEATARFKHRWKVFWTQDSFKDLRPPRAMVGMSDDLVARVHQVVESVPGDLRAWVRRRDPGMYRELTQLETSTQLLEDIDVGYGYQNLANRLIHLWGDMRRQWEAGK